MALIAVCKFQEKNRKKKGTAATSEKYGPKRPRADGETSSKKLRPPVWYLKWRDASGQQFKKSTRSRDERIAEQLRRTQEVELANDSFGGLFPAKANAKQRWSSLVKDFMTKKDSRPKTLEAYRYCGLAFEREMKDPLVARVNGPMLEQYRGIRLRLGRKPTTVNKELRHVGAVLNWAAKQGFIRRAPNWREHRCNEDHRMPVVVPEEVFKKMLAGLDDRRLTLRRQTAAWWKMFLILLHWTGCRTGELLGLQRQAIDLRRQTLKVVAESSKSRRERAIPLPDYIVAELQKWFRAGHITDSTTNVFPWGFGLRPLYDEWKQIETFANVPHHLLKHYRSSRACVLIAAGESTLTVKDWLGHSSVVTLERYYANASLRLSAAAEKLQHHLGGGTIHGTSEVM